VGVAFDGQPMHAHMRTFMHTYTRMHTGTHHRQAVMPSLMSGMCPCHATDFSVCAVKRRHPRTLIAWNCIELYCLALHMDHFCIGELVSARVVAHFALCVTRKAMPCQLRCPLLGAEPEPEPSSKPQSGSIMIHHS
jgi:hypothetical protein